VENRKRQSSPVKAWRNTVFHQKAQSGADYLPRFLEAGLRHFRMELLTEETAQAKTIIETYQSLMAGKLHAQELVSRLQVQNQLGVTSGTLTVLAG
jgi:U32 family peptidase